MESSLQPVKRRKIETKSLCKSSNCCKMNLPVWRFIILSERGREEKRGFWSNRIVTVVVAAGKFFWNPFDKGVLYGIIRTEKSDQKE